MINLKTKEQKILEDLEICEFLNNSMFLIDDKIVIVEKNKLKLINIENKQVIFTLDNKDVNISKNALSIAGLPFYISGAAKGNNTKLNFESSILSEKAARLLSEYIKQPYKACGNLNIKGTAEIDNGVIKLKSKIGNN